MLEYATYFFITFFLSTLFATGGVGSAIALAPVLNMLGISFNLAKTAALFVNTVTTGTATFLNHKRGLLELKIALPLALSSFAFAPLGAFSAKYIDEGFVKIFFGATLFIIASMMLFLKKEAVTHLEIGKLFLSALGSVIGFISGMLGIGGGSLIVPVLIMVGMEPKKVAVAASFVIPFSTLSAFLTYLSFVDVDYILIAVTATAALIGGYAGNHIMHFKLRAKDIRIIIAIALYILGAKLILG